MQTSQVSNAANVLASPAPQAKSGEASSSAPFEQVLSREIADRGNAKEANAAKDADKNQAAKSAAGKTPATPAENRQKTDADSTAPADSADSSDKVEDTKETAQASEDMLALVANLAQLVVPAAGEKKADPLAASALNSKAGGTVATRKTGTALDALTAKAAAAQPQDDALSATAAKGARADAMLADQGGKTVLVPGAATAGATVAGAATADFSAAMKESVSSLGASNQQLQGVQPGAVQNAQQLAANAAEKLMPRVGTPAWDQALGQKVVWMVAGEQQSASLTLNPPDLGPLQVALSVSNSQATATFTAAQPEVRQALEAALPKLREMLGEAGIQLGHASVNSGAQNQQGGEQQAAQHGRRIGQIDDGSEAQVHVSRVPVPAAGLGMVDTFV